MTGWFWGRSRAMALPARGNYLSPGWRTCPCPVTGTGGPRRHESMDQLRPKEAIPSGPEGGWNQAGRRQQGQQTGWGQTSRAMAGTSNLELPTSAGLPRSRTETKEPT
jgi:hypothetical protein